MKNRHLTMKHIHAAVAVAVFAFSLAVCNAAFAQQRTSQRPESATATAAPAATAAAQTAPTEKPVATKHEKAVPSSNNPDDVVPSDVKTREDFLRDTPDIPKRGGVSIWRFLGSLILVGFLIVALVFVLKQIYARGMRLDLKGRHIKVMDVVQLGPGRAVFLVRVGDKALLLGSADKGGLNYLADVTDTIDLEAAEEAAAAGTAQPFNFRRSLNEALGMKGKRDSETVSPAQFNSRLKDRLSKLEEDDKEKS